MATRIAVMLAPFMMAAIPAFAQSGDDVVIMRRAIAPPSDFIQAQWRVGDWMYVNEKDSCTSKAAQARTVSCTVAGRTVEDARCRGVKPNSVRTVERHDGCSYDLLGGTWGPWSSTCDQAATRERGLTCRRSDGVELPADRCPTTNASIPSTTDGPTAVLTGCSYRWEGGDAPFTWTSTCSTEAVQARTITCRRVGPVANDTTALGGAASSDSYCLASVEPKPATVTGGKGNYAGCTGTWTLNWYDSGQCFAGRKTQTSSSVCTGGSCDPRAEPKSQSRTVACKTTCNDLVADRSVSVVQGYGQSIGSMLTGTTEEKTAKAKQLCETIPVDGDYQVSGCILTSSSRTMAIISAIRGGFSTLITDKGLYGALCSTR